MNSIATKHCVICDARPVPMSIAARTCEDPQCRLAYQRHLKEARPTCQVCGRPLNALQSARRSPTCDEWNCRSSQSRQSEIDEDRRCRYCRVPLSATQLDRGVCDDRDCQRVHVDAAAAERERRKEAEFRTGMQQAAVLRDEVAGFMDQSDASDYYPLFVDWFREPLTPLPADRRAELRERLQATVDEYREDPSAHVPGVCYDNPWPDVGEDGDRLTSRICGHCRGWCCKQGGTHAFVSADTIATLLERRPELTVDNVVDAYLAELPATSYAGSCVFHAEHGCSLPHDMRAGTCGRFFCGGQQELLYAMEAGAPAKAFVALATLEGEMVEGRFLDGEPEDDS